MAAAIPTLDGLPYGVASRIPYYVGGRQSYSVYHGTAEAELLVQFLSKDISLSANNLAGTHLVEFVLSQGDKILHFLVEGEERDRGEEMIRSILNESSSPTTAGDAARWLVIMHKSKELLQVATTITAHRNATTVEEADVEDALYWLRLRATSAPHVLGVVPEGEFDLDSEWLPPAEEVEEEEIRLEEELDLAEDAGLDTTVQASSSEKEEEDEEEEEEEEEKGQGGEETSEGQTEETAREASATGVAAAPAQGPDTASVGPGGSSSKGGIKRKGTTCDAPRAPLSSLINAGSDGKKKAKHQQ